MHDQICSRIPGAGPIFEGVCQNRMPARCPMGSIWAILKGEGRWGV
jgi:hypothetical protein